MKIYHRAHRGVFLNSLSVISMCSVVDIAVCHAKFQRELLELLS
jgi:hypothetical protein